MAAVGETSTSFFDTDDAELSQLLSQAKQDLARKEAEAKEQAASQPQAARIALTVPLRLDTNDMSNSPLLRLDEQTGMAHLDIDRVYQGGTSASASAIDAQIDSKPAFDPTVRRKTPGELSREKQQTTGKRWFGMKAPTLTTEIKNDLRVLQLRNVLDPKRFYKKDLVKKLPKYFEMGTIIEGPTEFYSSRLTKKERRQNLVDELLADKNARDYFKRKVSDIHAHNESGGKKWHRARMAKSKGKGKPEPKGNKRQRK